MAVLEPACQAPVVESLEKADTEKVLVAGSLQGEREKAAATSVVICGPSGVGKGTLINKLMKEFPESFGFAVSHTTRMPRQGEKDSVHYHFTTRSVMEADIREARFLESADVHGNLYGTSIAAVDAVARAGKRCLLDIDVQGAQQVKNSQVGSSSLFIFVAPPSFEELERRLRGRGTEKEEQIQKRLKNAKAELEQGKNPSLFDHVLVNDNIEEAYSSLKRILGFESTPAPAPIVYQNGSVCENGSAHGKDAAQQNGSAHDKDAAHQNGSAHDKDAAHQNGSAHDKDAAQQNGAVHAHSCAHDNL